MDRIEIEADFIGSPIPYRKKGIEVPVNTDMVVSIPIHRGKTLEDFPEEYNNQLDYMKSLIGKYVYYSDRPNVKPRKVLGIHNNIQYAGFGGTLCFTLFLARIGK